MLFGPRWQSPLARALGIGGRSMRRYAAEERPVPPAVEDKIIDLCAAAQAERVRRVMGDLGGQPASIALTIYRTDYELLELTGEPWGAAFHRKLQGRVAAALIEGGIGGKLVEIDPEKYRRWLNGRENTPALRAAFAGSQPAK